MQHWTSLESAGLRAAAMSTRDDGDCALSAANAAPRRAFLTALGVEPARLVCPKQTHGVLVVLAREHDAGKGAVGPEDAIAHADAIITNTPGLPIGITVADCVPVALYETVRGAIGLAHAGRDGTVGQIAALTVHAMQSAFGCAPADLLAVIGPSAGPERYEVSEDLAAQFAAAGGPVQGRCLDLWEANRRQLLGVGVPEDHIQIAAICTLSTDTFHSFRRHKTAARNLVVLCL